MLALSFAAGAGGRVVWSMASDFLFKRREVILMIIAILGAAACFLLSGLTERASIWFLYLLSILCGISIMGWSAVWLTLVSESASTNFAGAEMSASYFFGNLGIILGPATFGLIADFFHSMRFSWMATGLFMIVASLLLLFLHNGSTRSPFHHIKNEGYQARAVMGNR
jgi:MFS family permease